MEYGIGDLQDQTVGLFSSPTKLSTKTKLVSTDPDVEVCLKNETENHIEFNGTNWDITDSGLREVIGKTLEGFLTILANMNAVYDFVVICDEKHTKHIDVAVQVSKSAEFVYIPIRLEII